MKTTHLISLIIGLATSISCFAQGGGSVNGPDLKGSMIPVYSDGEIPTEKLNSALDTCYKRMGEQVLGTILGRTVKLEKSMASFDTAIPSSTPAPINANESASFYSYYSTDSLSPSIVIQKDDAIRIRPKTNENYSFSFGVSSMPAKMKWEDYGYTGNLSFTFGFDNLNNNDHSSILLHVQNFPFISYELKDKSIYGELGELIDKKMFVSNIKFNFKPGTMDTVFTLKARRENGVDADSPIKVDSLDLIQCIKSNLAQ